jgi:hypothetical protein
MKHADSLLKMITELLEAFYMTCHSVEKHLRHALIAKHPNTSIEKRDYN